ncbi:hypothetical protein JTB14_000073 [Gonioctena quinquepunctata]|nr:hypothetical protein JTB14_000073 [Gonioctena quinquepunctata]
MSNNMEKEEERKTTPTPILIAEMEKAPACLYPTAVIFEQLDGQTDSKGKDSSESTSIDDEKSQKFPQKDKLQYIGIDQVQGDKPYLPPATLEGINPAEIQVKNLEKSAGKIVQIDGTTDLSGEDEASETSDNLKMKTPSRRKKVKKRKRSISQNTPAKSEQNTKSTQIHKEGKEPTPTANVKPPPIILEGKNIAKGNLETQIKEICTKGYYIKFLNNENQIHIANQLELGKVKEFLKRNKMGHIPPGKEQRKCPRRTRRHRKYRGSQDDAQTGA